MKTNISICFASISLTIGAFAQSTAFTYQGRLNHAGSAATGLYEMSFTLYDTATNGNVVGAPVAVAPVAISNGLFTVLLDYGATTFTGPDRWLEISVTVFGSDQPVTTLTPRQPITPGPYALHAHNAANLMSFANTPLDIKVNGQRALRLEPNVSGPNVIGGSDDNFVAPGYGGGTIAGGAGNTAIGYYATIGGGRRNTSDGAYATVAGGSGNRSYGYCTVGGGFVNTAGHEASTVAGGAGNTADADYATVGGGSANISNGDLATVGGGSQNSSSSTATTVGGGVQNLIAANAAFSTIAGGKTNSISSPASFIGGGESNIIHQSASHSTIAGGAGNVVSDADGKDGRGSSAFIGGGSGNRANADRATIAGGSSNHCTGEDSTIGGGLNNQATARYATVAGGSLNSATGRGAFVGGGGGLGGEFSSDVPWPNIASGNWSVVAGGANNFCDGWHSTIGGGLRNNTMGGNATVAGGRENDASAHGATVGGGRGNSAYQEHSTVAGGHANSCGGEYGTIGGGQGNEVYAVEGTVGGGFDNRVYGEGATIPGGFQNRAEGPRSFAAGSHAQALHHGAFVWADAAFDPLPFVSTTNNEFSARARGGVRFVTAIETNGTPTAGVSLASGSGTWSSLSDRNAKENFTPTEPREVLEKVAALPIATWNYKSQDKSIRHIGPTAQDFKAAFAVGETDTGITTVDADGVALAAIQGLNQKLEHELQTKDAQIRQLQSDLAGVKELLKNLTTK